MPPIKQTMSLLLHSSHLRRRKVNFFYKKIFSSWTTCQMHRRWLSPYLPTQAGTFDPQNEILQQSEKIFIALVVYFVFHRFRRPRCSQLRADLIEIEVWIKDLYDVFAIASLCSLSFSYGAFELSQIMLFRHTRGHRLERFSAVYRYNLTQFLENQVQLDLNWTYSFHYLICDLKEAYGKS